MQIPRYQYTKASQPLRRWLGHNNYTLEIGLATEESLRQAEKNSGGDRLEHLL